MWDEVVPLLRDDYRVTRYDMRGFGETVEDEEAEWAPREDLLEVLDAADVDRGCVVGVSMGGGAAINAALEHPERFSHLVVVNPGLGGFEYSGDEWEESLEGRIGAAFESNQFDECAAMETEMWLAGPHRTIDEMDPTLVAKMREWLLTSYGKPAPWSRAKRMAPAANDRLGDIAAPTLAVFGNLDVAGMEPVINRIVEAVPNASKVTMRGVAHLTPLEVPFEFAQILRDFLE
jgi:pimeloyl-ACP methyl ester carboxylesterase